MIGTRVETSPDPTGDSMTSVEGEAAEVRIRDVEVKQYAIHIGFFVGGRGGGRGRGRGFSRGNVR